MTCIQTRASDNANGFGIREFVLAGGTILTAEQVSSATSPYTGEGRSFTDIELAAQAVRQAYEDAGLPVVNVFASPQLSPDGRITLQVIEGKIRRITVRDNLHFDTNNIRRSLPSVREGEMPETRRILRDLSIANESPARFSSVNFQAGDKPGDLNANIRVRDENPIKTSLQIDNSGYGSTGHYRTQIGLRHANLFNRDHVINLQAGTFSRYDSGYVAAMSYRIPLYGTGRLLELQTLRSDINGSFKAGLADTRFNGRGQLHALRLQQTVSASGDWTHQVGIAAEYRDYQNRCTGGIDSNCGSISATPLSASWSLSLVQDLRQFSASIRHAVNTGAGGRGAQADYDALNAERRWAVTRASLQFSQTWPGDTQAQLTLNAQHSNDRLIPAEQMGVGGATSVRGYTERSIAGPRALAGSAEWFTPRWAPGSDSGIEARALLFFDAGQVGPVNRNGSDDTRRLLTSAGIGIRAQWGRDVSLKADWGCALKPLQSVNMPEMQRDRGDLFGHLALAVTF